MPVQPYETLFASSVIPYLLCQISGYVTNSCLMATYGGQFTITKKEPGKDKEVTKETHLIVYPSTIIIMRMHLRTGANIMNTVATARSSNKRSTNVYLTASLVDKARSMDMNLSATLDKLLAQAIEAKTVEREEEKQDMHTMNKFMAKAGMLTDDDFFGSL